MQTRICSLESAIQEIKGSPGLWTVISIRDTARETHHPFDEVESLCRDICRAYFDDISSPIPEFPGLICPTLADVGGILDWAQKVNRNNLLVHCQAGEHRSAAIAYLVRCIDMVPEEAVTILDPDIHFPTELVVLHGARALNREHVFQVCKERFSFLMDYDET